MIEINKVLMDHNKTTVDQRAYHSELFHNEDGER